MRYIFRSALIVVILLCALIAQNAYAGGSVGEFITEGVRGCQTDTNHLDLISDTGASYELAGSNQCRITDSGASFYTLTCINDTSYKTSWRACTDAEKAGKVQAPIFVIVANNYETGVRLYQSSPSYLTNKQHASLDTYPTYTIPNSINTISAEIVPWKNVSWGNYSYAFVVNSGDEAGVWRFNEYTVSNLVSNLYFNNSKTYNLNAGNFRGKYVTVYGFIRNNDGISEVPNMPVEVDDVVPMYFKFDLTNIYNTTAKPYISAPTNNQVLTNYPRRANLSWSSIDKAQTYDIEVACDICSYPVWSSVLKFNSVSTNYTTAALAGDNEFRTRVRAMFPGNIYGAWSDYVYFRYDTSQYCTDSDGGLNYAVRGDTKGKDEVTGVNSTYTDSCGYQVGSQDEYNGPFVAEKHCSNGVVHTQWYQCPNGCVNGACATPVDNSECSAICRTRLGTDGVCGGSEGDMQGSKYCSNNTQCVCKPLACSADSDCTKYNSHHKCTNNKCAYADCNTACRDFYGYESGTCGASDGVEVGSAFCKLSATQCKCYGKKEQNEGAIIAPYGSMKIGEKSIEVPWRTSITLTQNDVRSWGNGYATVAVDYRDKNYGTQTSAGYSNSLLFDGNSVSRQSASALKPGENRSHFALVQLPLSSGQHKLTLQADDANIAPVEQNNDFDISVWFQGFGLDDSNLPTCSDVRGGNVTFIVCAGYSVDHFWSGTRIKVTEHDGETAHVQLYNTSETETDLVLNEMERFDVSDKPGKYIEVTYLGVGAGNRALFRVNSNTTYDDRAEVKCGSRRGGDGTFLMCKNNIFTHTVSGVIYNFKTVTNKYILIKTGGKMTSKSIKINMGRSSVVVTKDGKYQVRVRYVGYSNKLGASVEFTTISAPVATGSVTYGVGVNDYPDHHNSNNSRNIANAYAIMYTVKLVNNEFIVTDYTIKSTGSGNNPGATFTIVPDQMVYFDGYKNYREAYIAANAKMRQSYGGNGVPPYKNFNNGENKLCQTNGTATDQYLHNDRYNNCSISLSTPYQD